MTIQSTDRKAGPFLSGTALPFEFKVFSKEDIAVIYTTSEGVQTSLMLDSDYLVTLNADQDNNPGGTVTLITAIVTGDRANIIGDLGYDQGTDIRNQSGFEPEIIEDALDRATIQIQQLKEITDRTLKTAPGDSRTGDELLFDIFNAEENAAASAAAAEASATRVDLGALDQAVADAEAAELGAQTAQGLTEAARDEAQLAKVNAQTAENNAEAAQALTEAARDAALLSKGLWPTTAAGIGNGVAGATITSGGSGGTNGTFPLAFSGGTQVLAPAGVFTVVGGAVVSVTITYPGYYSAGTPTLSFAASAGLTGTNITAVMAANTNVNEYFSVPLEGANDIFILYRVDSGPVATEISQYISSNGINQKFITLRKSLTSGITLPSDLSDGDAYAFVDEDGRRIASIRQDGTFKEAGVESYEDQQRLPRIELDSEYSSGFVEDETGRPLLAVKKTSGLTEAYGFTTPNGLAYLSSGQVRAVLKDGSDIALSEPGATYSRLLQDGNTVMFWRDGDDGYDEIIEEFIGPHPSLDPAITTLYYVPVYGQSNAAYFGARPITLAPDAPGRSLSFCAGASIIAGRLNSGTNSPLRIQETARLSDSFTNVVPVTAEYGETPAPGLGWSMAQFTGSDKATVVASLAIGGANIKMLSKGGFAPLSGPQNYRNVIRSVQRAKVIADILGLDLIVPAVGWIQGETDNGATYAAYDADYVALQASLNTDIQAVTGQSEVVLLAAHQTVKKVSSSINNNSASNVQLDRALAEPSKFLCSGPSYPYLHPDSIHTDGPGKRAVGEILGRAIARRLSGVINPMLYIASAVRSGSTVTLAIGGAEGSLVFDTTVTDPNGARGFEFVQTGGNAVSITDVQIVGSDVIITLSDTPTGTDQKIIAAGVNSVAAASPSSGPTTGPRCQVRDSSAFVGAGGGARYNYLCHQTITVTV